MSWRIVQKLSKIFDICVPKGIHEQYEKNFKQFIHERVEGYFCDSNTRTSKLIGIDLSEFGYDM